MSVAREKRIQEAMAWALKRMADLEAENAKLRERIERVNLEMQVEIATLDDKIAENARLNEKIEQLELLEARSAREAAMERKRAEFWRGHCEKRAKLIASVEWSDAERGWLACPECGGAMPGDPNFDESHPRHPKYHRDHYPGCDFARLMQMPEESKP